MKSVLILRFLLAFLFIFVGAQKILEPYQNFLYVIEAYDVFPAWMAAVIARTLPWIEVFLGVFLLLGLWTRYAVVGVTVLMAGFWLIVGQAVLRRLPIEECGCFGGALAMPLWGTMLFDTILLLACIHLLKHPKDASRWSLDARF